jgi:hypothetical protein
MEDTRYDAIERRLGVADVKASPLDVEVPGAQD